MKGIKVLLVAFCAAALSTASLGQTPKPTAFDMAELLVQGAGAEEIFKQAVEANIRVEPEYLGVRFYNASTNTELAENEVRELMGPVRQDGAYQMIAMAISMSNHNLGLNQAQLEALVDAAFIATLRRPPGHISIEFYDTRVGPSGVAGGPSGHVPDTVYREEEDETRDPISASQKEAIRESRALIASLTPDTDAEFVAMLDGLDIQADQRRGQAVLPIMAAGRTKDVLQGLLDNERRTLELHFGVHHIKDITQRISEPSPGVYLLIQVAYFTGHDETLHALESEMNGVFYR